MIAGEVLGKQYNLANVMRIVGDLAINGLHHGVGFTANGHGAGEVCIR